MEKLAVFHTSKATYRSSAKRVLMGFYEDFDPEHFGEHIYPNEEDGNVYDDSQNIVCTIKELESNNGTLNLDNEYDMYDWKPVSELTEEEISEFVYGRFGEISVEFNELYYLLNQPESVKILMDLKADADDIACAIYNELTVQDLINTIEGIGSNISEIIEEQKKADTVSYTRDEILQIHANMKKYGGGFISALSEAIVRADQENLKKIQNAFPDEFEKYLKF